jgi:primosomal protein N' (replication factor Y)
MCPNCDVSLTYHRHQESLRCHYCDYSLRVPESCPTCGAIGPAGKGIGTEQLAEQIELIFQNARVGRLDRDTGQGKGLREIIGQFREGKLDLLVGTQMVTKGHDFPRVTTVGVVLADLSLNFPDFRASERTFQLLTQVAGRAGRGETPGKVYIQTYNPEHYSLTTAREHDFDTFAGRELKVREEIAYPPFGHLIAFKFEATSEAAANQAARDYATAARKHLRRDVKLAKNVFLLGPALAPLARLKGKFRWQILLKSRSRAAIRKLAIAALGDVGYFDAVGSTHKNVRIIIDVDPLSML